MVAAPIFSSRCATFEVPGMGSITGAVVASLALGLLHSFASYALDDSWARILTYLLLYLTILVLPVYDCENR